MAKDISKTLIVGLGGTGQTVIRDIKKRMLRTYGEIPKLVKFLEFDTDKKVDGNTPFEYYYNGKSNSDYKYNITEPEFLLTPFLGVNYAKTDEICTVKINMDELTNVSARLNNKGAGGYRVCGRTIFLQNSQDIIRKLTETVSTLRSTSLEGSETGVGGYHVTGGGNINVFVIASMAGGTGSSSFMDMSRMLQIAGVQVENEVRAGTDSIFGIFFLPKFFEDKPHTQNIRINTYTALSELDYTWGLRDERTYPIGCKALTDDSQDYKESVGNDKRVVFSAVYLIDKLSSRSQTNSFQEASSYVASFIASSIAASNDQIVSCFVNSNHKNNTVEGKYQNYSGLGYCELRFNRQELVKYLLNRKLIATLEDYKNGRNVRANEIVETFIRKNSLNEGVKKDTKGADTRSQFNQLTDAILDISGTLFNDIHMGAVETDNNAGSLIENSKVEYLNRITAKVQETVVAFADRKEELLLKLRELLNEHQSGNGFGIFPDLARQLKTLITAMKKGLEEEVTKHEDDFVKTEQELEIIMNSITENNPGGIVGRGHRRAEQESWLQAYANKVKYEMGDNSNPTLARLKVEAARKREAIAIYEEMIKIVDEYYKVVTKETIDGPVDSVSGSYKKITGLYNTLMDLLILENNSYQPKKAAVKETLFADAYFKEYFEQHDADTMPLTPEAIRELDEYFKGIFTELSITDANKLAEMRNELLKHLPADGLIRKIQEERMSIDEVFIECYKTYGRITNPNDLEAYPQLKMLQQLEAMFDPLWQYKTFPEGLAPEKHMVVGVYDPDNHIFNEANGYSATINGWVSNREYVSLGDPDRIVFMLMETAIPAYKLVGVDNWAREFNQKKGNTYTYSDKRLENIEMLMPGAQDEAEIAWAYGWLFGLITNPTNRNALRVKPSYDLRVKRGYTPEPGGYVNYFNIEHPKDIYYCHQKFVNDQELAKDILNQAMALLDANPVDNIIKIKDWVNNETLWKAEVRGKENLTPDERKVIEREVKYLAMRFPRLGAEDGVELKNGRVINNDSDVLTNREEELKAKGKKTDVPEA